MGFHDGKGYWREDGEGFWDAEGYWVEPGGSFHDFGGNIKEYGDPFLDANGKWCEPGDTFFDGVGYQTYTVPDSVLRQKSDYGSFLYILLFAVPAVWIFAMVVLAAEWVSRHFYLVVVGYTILDAIVCRRIIRKKKHCGGKAVLSYWGSFISLYSLLYVVFGYALPYAADRGWNATGAIELMGILFMWAITIAILQFFNYYHEIAFWEFFLSLVYFLIILTVLRLNISMNTNYSPEDFATLYQVNLSWIFRLFFAFAA